jgi:hypothetical protein
MRALLAGCGGMSGGRMINITITQTITQEASVKKNLLKTKTPTEVKKVSTRQYDGGTSEEVQFAETYEVVDGTEVRTIKLTLLTQEIADDSAFDLKAVVRAINGL